MRLRQRYRWATSAGSHTCDTSDTVLVRYWQESWMNKICSTVPVCARVRQARLDETKRSLPTFALARLFMHMLSHAHKCSHRSTCPCDGCASAWLRKQSNTCALKPIHMLDVHRVLHQDHITCTVWLQRLPMEEHASESELHAMPVHALKVREEKSKVGAARVDQLLSLQHTRGSLWRLAWVFCVQGSVCGCAWGLDMGAAASATHVGCCTACPGSVATRLLALACLIPFGMCMIKACICCSLRSPSPFFPPTCMLHHSLKQYEIQFETTPLQNLNIS